MPNLVTVVGENTHILPHMLDHYKNIVDKIYVGVYMQNKNDSILEEIEDLGITPFMTITDNKYNWEKVTEIYNAIKITKPNDWWIVSDDDEFHEYPYDIEEIVKDCESRGYEFVTGGFLDRIGENGTFPKVEKNSNIQNLFPLAGFFRYPMSGACPNKVTLMKGSVKVTPGQHYVNLGNNKTSWGRKHPKRMPIEEVFTQVHHFKWDSTCIKRVKKVADVKKEYAYSKEYQKMYDSLKNSNFKIDVNNSSYMVEKLKSFSYIGYSNWRKLKNLIVKI